MATYWDVIFYLMDNARKSDPISGRKLAGVFGISGQEVRRIVNQGRAEGNPICANGDGYYIPEEPNDLLENIASMQHRMKSMQKAINGMAEAYARFVAEDENG